MKPTRRYWIIDIIYKTTLTAYLMNKWNERNWKLNKFDFEFQLKVDTSKRVELGYFFSIFAPAGSEKPLEVVDGAVWRKLPNESHRIPRITRKTNIPNGCNNLFVLMLNFSPVFFLLFFFFIFICNFYSFSYFLT